MNSPPDSLTEDASVIAESLERPDVFGELFRRHAADIHRYAARRLGDTSADDITAETFLIAFRKRAGYDLARPSALPLALCMFTDSVCRWVGEAVGGRGAGRCSSVLKAAGGCRVCQRPAVVTAC